MNDYMKHTTTCQTAFQDIYIDTDGSVRPCCYYKIQDHEPLISDLNSLEEWFFEDHHLQKTRDELSSNIQSTPCNYCWKAELEGKWTLRTSRTYMDKTPVIKKIHIAGGRECNLACRMCFPSASQKINDEARPWHSEHIKTNLQNNSNYNWLNDETNVDKLVSTINRNTHENGTDPVIELQLHGGEPQMMKGFNNLLDKISDEAKSRIVIHITTNGSLYNEKFWEEAVKFRGLTIGISIDAIGDRYNAIRYLGNWQETETNFFKILEFVSQRFHYSFNYIPNVQLNTVIQLANVDQCDSMDTFFQYMQCRFPKLEFFKPNLLSVTGQTGEIFWDLHQVPTEILIPCILDISQNSSHANNWKDLISHAIAYNNFMDNNYRRSAIQGVLDREKYFKKVHNINLWDQRPDWYEVYNRYYEEELEKISFDEEQARESSESK